MKDENLNAEGAPLCPECGSRCVEAMDGVASWKCPNCATAVLA